MTDPKQIIVTLRQEFEVHPQIVAFVLVGSHARDDGYTASRYSDMEAYIVTNDGAAREVEQQLPGVVANTGTVLFSFIHAIGFVAVYDDLFRLELPVVDVSKIETVFNRPTAQIVRVLFDSTAGKLQEVLDRRPSEIDYATQFRDKVTNFWYWQIVAVQYFKKGELYNSRAVLNIHASTLIWMFELLNDPKILLLETRKRIEEFLTLEQQQEIGKIAPAYDKDMMSTSLIRVMDIVIKTAHKIHRQYGYEYDSTVEQKVKPRVLQLLKS